MRWSRHLISGLVVCAGATGLLSLVILLETPPPSYVGLTLVVGIACYWGAWRGVFAVMGVDRTAVQTRDLYAYTSLFDALAVLVSSLWLLLKGSEPIWGGAAAGAAVSGIVFWTVAQNRYLPLRQILKPRVWPSDEAELARELAATIARFENPKLRGRAAAETRALEAVVTVAQELGRFEEAARILNTIDAERLSPAMRVAVQGSRAIVLLFLRDRNGAWRALKDAFAHADDRRTIAQLKLTDALATALDGHGAEALARLQELGKPPDAKFERAQLLTRANALAGLGDPQGARAALIELRGLGQRESMENVLDRAIALGGPALELAEQLKHEG